MRHLVFILTLASLLGTVGCRTCGSATDRLSEYSGMEPSGVVLDGDRVLQLTAQRYVFSPSVLVVYQGESIILRTMAVDVFHSLDVDDYKIHLRLPPHVCQVYRFTADKRGVYDFRCSAYCGDGHELMKGRLVVLPTTEVASR
jgi:cytochrome c oxidase subunit 2